MHADELAVTILQNVVTDDLSPPSSTADDPTVWAPAKSKEREYDLVALYLLALDRAPGGSFFFAENGSASFCEIAEMISRSLGFGGKTVSVSIEDLVRKYGDSGLYGITSNSVVSAVNARRIGWALKAPALPEYFAGPR